MPIILRRRLMFGLVLAVAFLSADRGALAEQPRVPVGYPNDEYWYDAFNPNRFGPNPKMFSDSYYDYPHAKPQATNRFGPSAYRFSWGYFGAQPKRSSRYHTNYQGHNRSWQVTTTPGR